MDDEDDAWSYSFPPSTESLPLASSSLDDSQHPPQEPKQKQTYTDQVDLLRRGQEYDDLNSQESSNSSAEHQPNSGELKRNRLAKLAPISRTSSRSSTSLQSPFLAKSIPANPHTTKEDASSVISKENLASGFEPHASGRARNSLLHNKSSSMSTYEAKEDNGDVSTPSPKIIAYRKSKKSISETTEPNTPTSPKGSLDLKNYSEDVYRDTPYHYAAMKRNTEFHQLFRVIDLTDRLLDDISCALSREILLQGRIYVSEHYVCFNSNFLGWVTSLVIRFKDIVSIQKKSTAGLFPNGILIETKDAKHTFASFLSRDPTYDFITTVWEHSRDDPFDSKPIAQEELVNQGRNSRDLSNETPKRVVSPPSLQTPQIESYILSIDGDDDVEDGDVSDHDLKSPSKPTVTSKVLKFKEESGYVNGGPDLHSPTEAEYTRDKNEIELVREIIDAPLGVVFDILFGSHNTKFHRQFLENHDGSEISEYGEFLPTEEDPTCQERSYTYRRDLGYSIGPKSTICEVSEVIEHLNFADYITILTTTVTPDVPSGQSFSVKTRYVLTWAELNKTQLVVSYYIQWTGKSWIKGIIEKQSLVGQTATAKDLIEELRKEIAASTYYVDGPEIQAVEEVQPASVETQDGRPPVPEKPTRVSISTPSRFTVSTLHIFGMALVLLFILQLGVLRMVSQTNDLLKQQTLLNTRLVESFAYQKSDDQFWDWLNSSQGKKLSRDEQIQFLTKKLDSLK